MKRLFDPSLVYPSDGIGPYIDLEGIVTRVGVFLTKDEQTTSELIEEKVPDSSTPIDVKTEYGEIQTYSHRPPKVGYSAVVRVYDAGNGFYPDNKIISWSAK